MTHLFDTHCHLYDSRFSADLDQAIQNAKQNNVKQILIPGEDLLTSRAAIDLCSAYPNFRFCTSAGIHPHHASEEYPNLATLKDLLSNEHVVAIGEIGLDYHWMNSEKESQKEVFKEQCALALEVDKPIILHNRESTDDILPILQDWVKGIPSGSLLKEHPGVFHAFSGDPQILAFAIENGFYLGIGGVATFKKAVALQESISKIPSDRMIFETDAPYLTPHPHRGKRNEPAYVRFVAQHVAQLLETPVDEMIARSTQNANVLFRLSPVK